MFVVLTVTAATLGVVDNAVTEQVATDEFGTANRELVRSMQTTMDLLPVVLIMVMLAVVVTGVMRVAGGVSMPRVQFRKYPTLTFGRSVRVDVVPESLDGERCVVCDRREDTGERRVWAKEFVVSGVPIWQYRGGTNHYCETCADPWAVVPIEIESDPEVGTEEAAL